MASAPQTFIDLSVKELVDQAIARKEGVLAANQALCVNTGKRTGRSQRSIYR